MSMRSAFSTVGLAHKLLLTAEKQGYTPGLLNDLAENETLLKQMLQVQLGYAEVKEITEYIIDLDVSPFRPDGWSVKEHVKGGSFSWDPTQVQLYFLPNQPNWGSFETKKLRDGLTNEPVFNANLLDYLLAHPHLIPEEWKKDEQGRAFHIFF